MAQWHNSRSSPPNSCRIPINGISCHNKSSILRMSAKSKLKDFKKHLPTPKLDSKRKVNKDSLNTLNSPTWSKDSYFSDDSFSTKPSSRNSLSSTESTPLSDIQTEPLEIQQSPPVAVIRETSFSEAPICVFVAPQQSPSRKLSAAINSFSKHNRTSVLRLEKLGYMVEVPEKEIETPSKTSKIQQRKPTPHPDPPSHDELFQSHDENIPPSTPNQKSRTPHAIGKQTPLQAFVKSLPDSASPVTRSKRKQLESEGQLAVYREKNLEVYAPSK